MKKELYEYLETFVDSNNWTDGNIPEQARAIFTTICLTGYIDADTDACDRILKKLYAKESLDDADINYEDFEQFMVRFIA